VCIGCKACEVACKQWNDLPADGYDLGRGRSFDHTGSLSAATWRHVHFVEIAPDADPDPAAAQAPLGDEAAGGAGGHIPNIPAAGTLGAARQDLDLVALADSGVLPEAEIERWLFASDVCKHCTNAGCLDACPTGALIRTEFETVLVQPDICNGCGYCVTACPFGVIDRDPYDGRAAKCTLCYDRLQDGLEPACAKACPTDSIQFGPYDELVEARRAARHRAARARARDGVPLRRGRRGPRPARGRPRRLLPADGAAGALRPARPRGLPPSRPTCRSPPRPGSPRACSRPRARSCRSLVAHRRARR
jgi:formate dehydrogenase iron-sulfur subunit